VDRNKEIASSSSIYLLEKMIEISSMSLVELLAIQLLQSTRSIRHDPPVDHAARVFIKWARYPAPKPLSIFTTPIPGAQAFSIVSSAAVPPSPVP
jgi:hypothetical protein